MLQTLWKDLGSALELARFDNAAVVEFGQIIRPQDRVS